MDAHTIEVDGIRMRWLEQGEGTPVVLLHGLPTSPELWRKVMPKLIGPRVLAWEMVGYGQSIPEGVGRDVSVRRQAEYLLAWLRAVGVDHAVLVGHGLGGGVAQIAAVREPARCAGLVLTNSIAYDSWPVPSVRAMRAAGRLIERMPEPALRTLLATMIFRGHDDMQVARESLDVHFAPYARHGGATALVRQVRALYTGDTIAVQDQLPSLRDIPARVVWGAADHFQKVSYGERLARDLGCPLARIQRGKHFTPEDHAEDVVYAIEDVVAEARQRRRVRPEARPS